MAAIVQDNVPLILIHDEGGNRIGVFIAQNTWEMICPLLKELVQFSPSAVPFKLGDNLIVEWIRQFHQYEGPMAILD